MTKYFQNFFQVQRERVRTPELGRAEVHDGEVGIAANPSRTQGHDSGLEIIAICRLKNDIQVSK
jgi:hypothetical protein